MKRQRLCATVVVSLALGCASMGGMRSEPLEAGKSRTFEAPVADVVRAAREAATGSGLQIEDAYQAEEGVWVLLCKRSTSGWSWGELVRVVVAERSETETVVRVITRRRAATNITARGDYSESIFSGIELALH